MHNSNIPDAICFVLGRLSIKSMRASRASKLIYHGGKDGKPSQFAKVDLVFDNSNQEFPLQREEVEISRIVKKDGNSVYKINEETKTRQEVLELLGQAGIDPEGFNIILQGQIDGLIRMPPDEKRQIIEEIAGISIYEERKEKSLHELEKTDGKLKEVRTILNERKAYLNNLEREREQALKHESLKNEVKKCKVSIIARKVEDLMRELMGIERDREERLKNIEKLKQTTMLTRQKIGENNKKISAMEEEIEKKTGIEQEQLRSKILELKTEIARLNMKRENTRDQISSLESKEKNNLEEILRLKQELKETEEKSHIKITPTDKSRYDSLNKEIEELKQKIKEFGYKEDSKHLKKIELEKKGALVGEKGKQLALLNERILEIEQEMKSKPRFKKVDISELRNKRLEHQKNFESRQLTLREIENEILKLLTRKEIQKKDIEDILNLSQCPKCKQQITSVYKDELTKRLNDVIKEVEKEVEGKTKSKKEIEKEIETISKGIQSFIEKEQQLEKSFSVDKEYLLKEQELYKLSERRIQSENDLSILKNEMEIIKKEILNYGDLSAKIEDCEKKVDRLKEALIKIKLNKPLDFIERDLNIEMELKKRELEQAERNVKEAKKENSELSLKLKEVTKEYDVKAKELENREKEQGVIEKKFRKFFEEKQKLQEEIHGFELNINEKQMQQNLTENQLNDTNIERARLNASRSVLETEMKEYGEIEIIKASLQDIEKRLERTEQTLQELGSVNLRALEIYDKIKAEYEEIDTRVQKLEQEKGEIVKIIEEIDKRKKKSFMQTFTAINDTFNQNYSMLSKKGWAASLILENQEDPFAGGMNMEIKLGKGKYMDSELLSGGEKVIVALALIFAIQKYKPYHFYIFDEIDAALDKVNSEVLANLIKQNLKNSQYLMITHNDVMISNAEVLYGTSMQEGITRVFSMRV
ncbi:MAG: chromosome segregation SMC family protein [Candidatus Pacearchaeota archaeon]|nr:chromosome segregation SMC family protein [Candidatus Pacearchaeota archaeon]